MLTAITGVNWGDEGKGRMVDLLSEQYDIVVRYQGGNNAGHTVINEKGIYFSSSSANAPVFIMASGVAVVMMSALEPKSAALFAKGSTQEVIVPA